MLGSSAVDFGVRVVCQSTWCSETQPNRFPWYPESWPTRFGRELVAWTALMTKVSSLVSDAKADRWLGRSSQSYCREDLGRQAKRR